MPTPATMPRPRPGSRRGRPSPRFGVGLVVAALGAWALSYAAARALVVHDPLEAPDALIVMSGAPVYQERLAHAAAVARRSSARVLLTNDGQRGSWSRALQRNPTSIERAVDTLVAAGVSRGRIEVLPNTVHSTIDEARAVALFAPASGIRSLLVVTSPHHSRRAVWAMRQQLTGRGVRVGVDPVPSDVARIGDATWWMSPSGWRTVALEFVKLPFYHWAYSS